MDVDDNRCFYVEAITVGWQRWCFLCSFSHLLFRSRSDVWPFLWLVPSPQWSTVSVRWFSGAFHCNFSLHRNFC
jgi:hypothetical protein